MAEHVQHRHDPLGWTWLIVLGFAALAAIRLEIPTKPYFDEVHYLPAARGLLDLARPINQEHPMLGKELIALGIMLFGDNPLGWRIMPWLGGALALFAAMRALWFTSLSRFATLAYGLLLGTGFLWFVHARIAMLDIFMLAFLLTAFWQLARAMREECHHTRRRLALAGLALGLSLASKWTGATLAVVPGLTLLAFRLRSDGWRFLWASSSAPLKGVSLTEAALWLGLLPLLVYFASFAPALFYAYDPLTLGGLLPFQLEMIDLQQRAVDKHPYQSLWYHWVGNWRAIWYLYEVVDGAQRGVMLIGNPLTMLLGLPALAWCAWAGFARRRADAGAVALLYLVSMILWVVAPKPVQFYFHYLVPSCFLLAALALALDDMWERGNRWVPAGVLAGSAALFAWFYPALSAAELADEQSFLDYAWIASWR